MVGFVGPNVAWVRDDKATVPAQARAARRGHGPEPKPAAKGAQNRKFVLPGRYCEHVFAEIGAADREESGAAPPPGGDAQSSAESVKRYFYDPAAGDPSMRTAFSCVDGKVIDVERTVVQ